MARCNECYAVITRSDSECYVCGLPVQRKSKLAWRRNKEEKPAPLVTPFSNLLFIASLALTLFSFLAPNRIPISIGVTLGGILFVARLVSDRIAKRQQRLALSPVTLSRLHN